MSLSIAITDIQVRVLSIPFDPPVGDSTHLLKSKDVIVVDVHTNAGVSGMGYLITFAYGVKVLHAMVEDMKPLLIGEDPTCTERLWKKMWMETNFIGRKGVAMFALSAYDVALWDIKGKIANLPLHKLLGGNTESVSAYGSGGWLSYSLERLIGETTDYVSKGFTAVKMKIGQSDMREDIRRVAAVRDAVGDGVNIMVDANQKWNMNDALRIGRELEKLDVYWLEEPLPADDITGHAQLAQALDIQIATGETEYGKWTFKELIDHRGVDIVQPDVQRVGGITEYMKVSALAEAFNLKVCPHFFYELHIHMAAATTNTPYLEYFDWMDDAWAEPVVVDRGNVIAPNRPGHGLAFSEEAWRKFELK